MAFLRALHLSWNPKETKNPALTKWDLELGAFPGRTKSPRQKEACEFWEQTKFQYVWSYMVIIRYGSCPQTDDRLGGDRHINKLLHTL